MNPHVMACRGAIANLLRQSNITEVAIKRQRFAPNRPDISFLILENQTHLLRSLAFLLDECLAAEGEPREIHFRVTVQDQDGKGVVSG